MKKNKRWAGDKGAFRLRKRLLHRSANFLGMLRLFMPRTKKRGTCVTIETTRQWKHESELWREVRQSLLKSNRERGKKWKQKKNSNVTEEYWKSDWVNTSSQSHLLKYEDLFHPNVKAALVSKQREEEKSCFCLEAPSDAVRHPEGPARPGSHSNKHVHKERKLDFQSQNKWFDPNQ